MVYSDRMQLTEARQLLSRAVELDPGHANGQVALGIAALRDNDPDGAQGPLEKAVVLAPRNPYALRALGQLLLMKDNVSAALPPPTGRSDRCPGRSDQPVHLRPGPARHRGRVPRDGSW
jgi:tetratricopeptide (TPR) repeat protein